MRRRAETSSDIQSRATADGECRNWQGAIGSRIGYGKVRLAGVTMDAHRAAWVAAHGEISDGLVVMHSCDNRRCIRLEHLSLGTQQDNMRDASKKGRLPQAFPKGHRAASTKLTDVQVQEIRDRLAQGVRGAHLAEEFGVVAQTISKIKHGQNWAVTA